MSVVVIDQIAPKNNGAFGIVQDTFLIGGWRTVADITERNAIPNNRRREEMRARVVSEQKTYALIGGIDNANWIEVSEGGGGATDVELTGNVTLSVTTTGDDSDPTRPTRIVSGSWTSKPFATIQGAIDSLPRIGKPYVVTINVSVGTYPGFVLSNFAIDVSIIGVSKVATIATGPTSGTATSGTNRTLTLTGAGWTVDNLAGKFLAITSGAGAGQTFPISANTATVITIAGIASPAFAAGSVFAIQSPGVVINTVPSGYGSRVNIRGNSSETIRLTWIEGDSVGSGFGLYNNKQVIVDRCVCQSIVQSIIASGDLLTFIRCFATIYDVQSSHNVSFTYCLAYRATPSTTGFRCAGAIQWLAIQSCVARNCTTGLYAQTVNFIDCDNLFIESCTYGLEIWRSNCDFFQTTINNCGITTTKFLHCLVRISGFLSGTDNTNWGFNGSGGLNVFHLVDSQTITGSLGNATVNGSTTVTWASLASPGTFAADAVSGARIYRPSTTW